MVEQLEAVEGLRQQAAILGQRRQIDGFSLDVGVQHLADVDDAHQFRQAAVTDREEAVAILHQSLQVHLQRQGEVEIADVAARHHQ